MLLRSVRPEARQSVRPGRVAAVMEFGFPERQARFLAHVLVFSGVFIERQYRAFTGLAHGQKTHDFLAKLVTAGYARVITLARCTAAGCITSPTSRSTRLSERRTIATARWPRWAASSSD